MASAQGLLPNGEQTFIDANGNPLAGGFVYMYVPGTTTPKTTWQDQGLTTANSTPITLDSAGRARIWGAGSYRQVITDSLGNTIWDQPTSLAGNVTSVNSLTALKAWPAHEGTVIRLGYASAGDGGRAQYNWSAGACTIAAGAGDNGSQVKPNTGTGCWLADFSSVLPNVKVWGAICDSTTDDYTAITAAISAQKDTDKVLYFPSTVCRSSASVVNPAGMLLRGTTFFPDNPGSGSGIICDLAVTPCVVTSGNSTSTGLGLAASGLEYLFITRAAGTPPVNSIGVKIIGGHDVVLDHILVTRHYDGYYFFAPCTTPPATGCVWGISSAPSDLYSGYISGHHLVVNNWPEIRIVNSRFGLNGESTSATSMVYITGGAGGGGEGPNTVYFDNTQFNATSTYFWEWEDITGGGSNVVEWKANNIHVEGVTTALFKSHSNVALIDRFTMHGATFNTPTAAVFALDPATGISNFEWSDNEFICTDMTLAPTPQITGVTLSANFIGCPTHFTNGAAGSTLSLMGNNYGGNMTLDGSANWGFLSVMGGSFIAGTLTNNTTAASNTQITVAGSASSTDCATNIGFKFGGASVGMTYATKKCKWQMTGNLVIVAFDLTLSAKGSSVGAATLEGLPKASAAVFGPGYTAYAGNMAGLAGTVLVVMQGGNDKANIFQSDPTGSNGTTDVNFTDTTRMAGTIIYVFQ